MSSEHLSNDEFFNQLSTLLTTQREKSHGSVFLTQKRLTDHTTVSGKDDDGDEEELHPKSPSPLLVRATNGKSKESRAEKVKISTVVRPDAVDGFFTRYAEVCKAGMQALKKRDRSGRKRAKAKKRKGGGGGGGGGGGAEVVVDNTKPAIRS
ncbi:MAG: hypothetical protein M1816_003442 [Peltula sp. TS41687]|nr:MAG: hypothetical protein M1816_003442 [Peltula sp. TS41687]